MHVQVSFVDAVAADSAWRGEYSCDVTAPTSRPRDSDKSTSVYVPLCTLHAMACGLVVCGTLKRAAVRILRAALCAAARVTIKLILACFVAVLMLSRLMDAVAPIFTTGRRRAPARILRAALCNAARAALTILELLACFVASLMLSKPVDALPPIVNTVMVWVAFGYTGYLHYRMRHSVVLLWPPPTTASATTASRGSPTLERPPTMRTACSPPPPQDSLDTIDGNPQPERTTTERNKLRACVRS